MITLAIIDQTTLSPPGADKRTLSDTYVLPISDERWFSPETQYPETPVGVDGRPSSSATSITSARTSAREHQGTTTHHVANRHTHTRLSLRCRY